MTSINPPTSDDLPTVISAINSAGTSLWLDDLSRERLDSGNLAEVIANKGIVGVTTNPAIFQSAMSKSEAYDAQIRNLAAEGFTADDAVFELASADVTRACDVLAEVYNSTDGVDGRVSIEVDPRLANDTEGTIAQAKQLWEKINRHNLMIKIPATDAGLPAITAALAAGISVNVTLIFSVERYRQVLKAFTEGIEQAQQNGHDISTIHSVASFFISRLDSKIDDLLQSDDEVRGKAGIANARAAYSVFEEYRDSDAWTTLLTAGARLQRPLWASTSTKDPSYPEAMYVTELVGPDTVNTLPEPTLDAALALSADDIVGDTVSGRADEASELYATLTSKGIDLDSVFHELEVEGVDKFVGAWEDLLETLQAQLESAQR